MPRTALVNVFVSPVSVPDSASGIVNAKVIIELDGNDLGWSLRVTSIGSPNDGRASIQRYGTVTTIIGETGLVDLGLIPV